jgi:glycosyltransferase involved in cell wall biosynthesis
MTEDLPLVSIVTPSYNQADYLPETIESVLRQDYPNIEYMVIDGGSTDGTLEILNSYNNRFFWVSVKDKGQAHAINKGWKKAKGSILAYLNSDDTYYSNKAVSQAVEAMKNNRDTGIVYGGSIYTNCNGNEIGTYYNAYPFDYNIAFSQCLNPIPQPSAFIHRGVIERTGYLDENIQCSIDWDLWLRAGRHFNFQYIPEILSTYRLHADSKSLAHQTTIAHDWVYIYTKLFSDSGLPQSLKDRQCEIMGLVYIRSAESSFAGGDFISARKTFLKAMNLNIRAVKIRHYIKFMLSLISPVGDGFIKKHYKNVQDKMLVPVKKAIS